MNNESSEFDALINSMQGPFGMYGVLLPRASFSINNILLTGNRDIKKLKKYLNDTLKIEADYLIRHRKAFIIYKWTHKVPVWGYTWSQPYEKTIMSYVPFIKFSLGKFSKIAIERTKPNKALIAMHLWLNDEETLHNWLGSYYEQMIVDML